MGAFAEYITVHETAVLPVPDHVSFGEASCTEPLASVVKADQEICHVTAGDTVVVYGLGPMGCLHVQVCRLLGAFVVGIDLQPERRRLAQKLGAVVVIDPGTDDPVTA
ncbi:MAG: zinc-binding dehydrogenase, partial [Bacillota bacterium]